MRFSQVGFLAATALLSASASPPLRAQADDDKTSLRRDTTMEYMLAMTGPTCANGLNYNYVGNDIGSLSNIAQSGDCCEKFNNLAGCHAYSWTDYNGGTCWFKSGRGTVIEKTGVVSAMLTAITAVPSCNVEFGIDYVGHDLASWPLRNNTSCCWECLNLPGCRAVTHSNGECYFKTAKVRMVVITNAALNVYSVDVYPPSNDAQCGLEQGVDYVGNDIANVPGSTASDCCAKCQSYNGCRAFSWTNQNGGTCWLKNLKGDTVANANVVSCAILPNPAAPSCALEIDTDYVGNDIGSAASSDAYGCCSICMARSGCKAFSWTNQSGGTCYLKSDRGSTTANANVKSAVV